MTRHAPVPLYDAKTDAAFPPHAGGAVRAATPTAACSATPPCFTALCQARRPSACTWPAKATPAGPAPELRSPASAALLPGARCEVVAGDVLDSILDRRRCARSCGPDPAGPLRPAGRRRSLARRLAMKAPCSVWMVPDRRRAVHRAASSSPSISRRSRPTPCRLATALAEAAGLDECIALHVYFNQAAVTFDEFDEIVAEDRDRAFGIFVAPINLHGVLAKPLFVEAPNVAQTILRIAAEQAATSS